MKVRVPQYFDNFRCLGSKCPDTCCIGWLIEIDEISYERFMTLEGAFGDRIRENIIEREDGHFFKLKEDGRCPFLNDNNLCEMVIDMGDKSLCSLCDNYPRIGTEFGNLREMGLSFSCPEVSRLILSSEREIKFGEWTQLDEIKGTDFTKDALFIALINARDVAFYILQNREYSITNRVQLYLMFVSNIQVILDEEESCVDRINNILLKYQDKDYFSKCLNSINDSGYNKTREMMIEIVGFIKDLETININWTDEFYLGYDFVLNSNDNEYADAHKKFAASKFYKEYEIEHLLVYYTYRYFMKVIFDGDIFSKAVMGVVAAAVIREIDVAHFVNNQSLSFEEQVKIMYLYSKEIEHCEENVEKLCDEIWDNEIFETKFMIENIAKIM